MTTEMHSTAAPRDPLEIEGALLPPEIPVATAVSGEAAQTTSTAVAAVPLSHFAYNTTQETRHAADEEEQYMYDDIPTAPFLPPYDDSEHRERKEADALARAKQNGRLAAEVERVEIERANRKINSIEWHTKQGVKDAKIEAERRNREGVQIKEDKWFGHEEEKDVKETDPDRSAYTGSGSGGYEIADYDTSDYKGSNYETSEYKSVYDP